MKFEASVEVAAPQDYTFARFSEFTRFEQAVRRFGADIRRVNGFTAPAEGVTWRGSVVVKGRARGLETVLSKYQRPQTYQLDSAIGGMLAVTEATFSPLSADQTRVVFAVELKPRTLQARLIIQAAKLARGRLQTRLENELVKTRDEIARDFKALQEQG